MFGPDDADLARRLIEMERVARDRCFGNQVEARERLRQWLKQDRSCDQFDHDRLISRIQEVTSCARSFDLDDPYLQRGGSKRPLSF
jgi:hypothetical protein